MNVKEFLDKVAYTQKSETAFGDCLEYRSKFDDSYITLEGMEDNIKYLADHEITEELTHGVGFSPKDNKWYGWSHRAIYGFEIGSTCKKGDCHYVASTPEELIDDHANFFSDFGEESVKQRRDECQVLEDGSGIRVLTTPVRMPVVDMSSLPDALEDIGSLPEETLFKDNFYTIECGKGAWEAKTMEDAKQMAADFNSGVS